MTLRRAAVVLVGLGLFAAAPASASASGPPARISTTCSDYSNQADAQRGADTRDPDGDGVYCESLPCPCAKPGSGGGGGSDNGQARRRAAERRAAARRRAAVRRRAAARRRAAKRRAARREAERISRQRRAIESARARIIAVTDGDTLTVRLAGSTNRIYKVRLLGIDTPESRKPGVSVECGAKEATSLAYYLGFTAPTDRDGDGLLDTKGGAGVKVRVKTDRSQDLFDAYDRLLAYIDVPAGARGAGFPAYDFGQTIIAAGFSKAYTFKSPVARSGRYKAAQSQARSGAKGVWSTCGGDFHSEQ